MNTHPQSHPSTALARKSMGSKAMRLAMNLTHNSMALVGLAIATLVLVLLTREDLRQLAEEQTLSLLLDRQESRSDASLQIADPLAAERATAVQVSELPKAQANVALWLSRKYMVAPEPLSVLVSEAFHLGEKIKIDPTLILAVMAVESRFNPFAQSNHGAQGLMQVLTRVHTDKYEDFGGALAAFDPVTNLRVGVQVLQDCIQRAGSIEGGLGLYVGAVSTDSSQYVTKVMGEHIRLRDVAMGKRPMSNFTPPTVPGKPTTPPVQQPSETVMPATESAQAPDQPARGV